MGGILLLEGLGENRGRWGTDAEITAEEEEEEVVGVDEPDFLGEMGDVGVDEPPDDGRGEEDRFSSEPDKLCRSLEDLKEVILPFDPFSSSLVLSLPLRNNRDTDLFQPLALLGPLVAGRGGGGGDAEDDDEA